MYVIAVFAKDNTLASAELYVSIVLVVYVSDITPPFVLHFTISHYNKVLERTVQVPTGCHLRAHDKDVCVGQLLPVVRRQQGRAPPDNQ